MKKKKLVSMLDWATLLAHNNVHPLELDDFNLLISKIRESFDDDESKTLIYIEEKLVEDIEKLKRE